MNRRSVTLMAAFLLLAAVKVWGASTLPKVPCPFGPRPCAPAPVPCNPNGPRACSPPPVPHQLPKR